MSKLLTAFLIFFLLMSVPLFFQKGFDVGTTKTLGNESCTTIKQHCTCYGKLSEKDAPNYTCYGYVRCKAADETTCEII